MVVGIYKVLVYTVCMSVCMYSGMVYGIWYMYLHIWYTSIYVCIGYSLIIVENYWGATYCGAVPPRANYVTVRPRLGKNTIIISESKIQ